MVSFLSTIKHNKEPQPLAWTYHPSLDFCGKGCRLVTLRQHFNASTILRLLVPITFLHTHIWRGALKISRKDKISEVLRRVNHKRGILGAIKKRKHSWLGHTLRHDGFLGDISEE